MLLPDLPEAFTWIQEPWGPALRCRPLHAIAPHLFTTRQQALSSPADWGQVAAAIGAERVQTLTQVHGCAVATVRKGAEGQRRGQPGGRPEADAIVSDDPSVAIAVRAADCVPLLLADPRTGGVAAVHAGWRGTAAGAATAAVDALRQALGSEPSELVAAIGPSIGPCCYDVGPELVDAFAAAGHARRLIDRWFLAPGGAGALALRLDLWRATRDLLALAGLDEERIYACGLCTASHVALFPSYRVERDRAGRLAGAIRARPLSRHGSPPRRSRRRMHAGPPPD